MKEITLSKGFKAIVDDQDFERVSQYKWSLKIGHTGIHYAFRTDKNNKSIYLHRFILNAPKRTSVDHKNHNGLDNRRMNIRVCNWSQNAINSRIAKNNTSGYKGIYWDADRNKWAVQIEVNQHNKFLGRYKILEEAIKARKQAESLHFGDFI